MPKTKPPSGKITIQMGKHLHTQIKRDAADNFLTVSAFMSRLYALYVKAKNEAQGDK